MAYQLKRIHDFLNLKNSNIRPVYEAVFLQLHLDKDLKDENFLILKFGEDYYEYIKFQLDDHLFEIKYQHFSTAPRRFEELQAINQILSKSGDLLRIKYIDDQNYIQKSIDTYLTRKHEIIDFLLLDVLPYSIKVFNGSQQIAMAPLYLMIPGKTKPVQFTPTDAKLRIVLQMAKQEVSTEIPLGFHKGEKIDISIDIDTGFSTDLLISDKRYEI
ncbi:MAG: hypothetical protein LC101_03600 [Flavobacteriales bacterium]|nr:hypothetical protein [Flavobacteriales bacterium]